jgi:hypothetical protein
MSYKTYHEMWTDLVNDEQGVKERYERRQQHQERRAKLMYRAACMLLLMLGLVIGLLLCSGCVSHKQPQPAIVVLNDDGSREVEVWQPPLKPLPKYVDLDADKHKNPNPPPGGSSALLFDITFNEPASVDHALEMLGKYGFVSEAHKISNQPLKYSIVFICGPYPPVMQKLNEDPNTASLSTVSLRDPTEKEQENASKWWRQRSLRSQHAQQLANDVRPEEQPGLLELQTLDDLADQNSEVAARKLQVYALDQNAAPKTRRRALFLLGYEMEAGIARDTLLETIRRLDGVNDHYLKEFGKHMAGLTK